MELESPLEKTQHRPTEKPKTTKNHRMQQPRKLNTDQRKKPRTATQKTQTDQPKKKKTQNINLENTNRPAQKTQTHNRKYSIGDTPTQKKQKTNQKTNQTINHRKRTFGAEINNPKPLWCRVRQTHGASMLRS